MQLKITKTNPQTTFTYTVNELPLFAKAIHDFLQTGDWLFLIGDLGAGKTALSQHISNCFGVKNIFTSPTFSILNSEKITTAEDQTIYLLHLDLYRLKSGKELCYIGLEQEFNVKNSIAIFEWPDVLDEQDWDDFFKMTGCAQPTRILTIHIDGLGHMRTYQCNLNYL